MVRRVRQDDSEEIIDEWRQQQDFYYEYDTLYIMKEFKLHKDDSSRCAMCTISFLQQNTDVVIQLFCQTTFFVK